MSKTISAANSIRLATGNLMPKVGFGTWKIAEKEAGPLVYGALKAGYRLIDCAAIYQNEKSVGQGMEQAKNEKIVKREDIYITSKLWNTDHAPQDVRPALERTLRDLKVDYLDLYLMHFPVAWPNRRTDESAYPEDFNKDFQGLQQPVPVSETWQAMEELVTAGLVKDIGVSNFGTALIWELSKVNKVAISVNQFEMHPFLQQTHLVDLCQSKNIAVTAYSSFGSPSYENWAIYGSLPNLLESDEIIEISEKHRCTPAQVLLAWAVNDRSVAVIPKTANTTRLQENLDVLNIKLDEHDNRVIEQFDRGLRFNDQALLWGIPIH